MGGSTIPASDLAILNDRTYKKVTVKETSFVSSISLYPEDNTVLEKSEAIFNELKANGIIDNNGIVSNSYRPDQSGFSLGLTSEYAQYESDIMTELNKYYLKIPDGWEIIGKSENVDTGFAGLAFRNTNNGEIVVTCRGTEFPAPPLNWDFRDVWNGVFNMMAGQPPAQLKDARDFYNSVKDNHVGAHITLTGHSLGGALAQLVGLDNGGVDTVTFNSAGIGNLREGRDYSHIINYVTPTDFTASALPQVGEIRYVDSRHAAPTSTPDPISVICRNWFGYSSENFSIPLLGSSYNNAETHGLDNFAAGFQYSQIPGDEFFPVIQQYTKACLAAVTVLKEKLKNLDLGLDPVTGDLIKLDDKDIEKFCIELTFKKSLDLVQALFGSGAIAQFGEYLKEIDLSNILGILDWQLFHDSMLDLRVGPISMLKDESYLQITRPDKNYDYLFNDDRRLLPEIDNKPFYFSGLAKDEVIVAGKGDSILLGAGGDDHLIGNAGNDILVGDGYYLGIPNDIPEQSYDDPFTATYGYKNIALADIRTEGLGNDMLEGGDGDDTYVFSVNFGKDTIIDSDNHYKIVIDGVDLKVSDTLEKVTENGREIYKDPNGFDYKKRMYFCTNKSTQNRRGTRLRPFIK